MEEPRPESLETVAARVVAWHNRHPLARRIHAEQVQSVGYVALPYWTPAGPEAAAGMPQAAASQAAAPAGGTLRERAAARAKTDGSVAAAAPAKPDKSTKPGKRGRGLKAAFTEDFIAPLSPKRVARWAARHAVPLDQAPRGAPLRQVQPSAAFADKTRELQTLYVQTAMVESRGKRVRMLLSPSSDTAVLGGRLWSPPRVAGGAAGALGGLAAMGLALALWWQPPTVPAAPAGAASSTVSQVQAQAHAERPASAAAPPSIKPASMRAAAQAEAEATHIAALPASAAADAQLAAKPSAEPPPDVEPHLGRITLPPLGLPHGDEARTAARERRLAQQAPATAAAPQAAAPAPNPPAPASPALATPVAVATAAPLPAAPAAPATPPTPPAPSQSQAMAASATGQAFALSSRRLRTRAETEQTVAAVRALLAGAGHSGVQVEMMPAGDDWRIVSWPFGQRAQAEQARTLLASRGIRLEVVAF